MFLSFFAAADKEPEQHHQQNRHQHKGRDNQLFDHHGIGSDPDVDRLGQVFHPVPPDQQPVGIDALGGAGPQGTQILAQLDGQILDDVGLHDADLVHLIGQRLFQHMEHEQIPHRQLVQIREQTG